MATDRADAGRPTAGYLALLGELAFAVTDLEWAVLNDTRLVGLDLNVELMLAKTTTQIGRDLDDCGAALDPSTDVGHFVRNAAKALLDVAPFRNNVLHSRPATTPIGETQLYRLTGPGETRETAERFWIDEAYLERAIARVTYWRERLQA